MYKHVHIIKYAYNFAFTFIVKFIQTHHACVHAIYKPAKLL